MDLKRDELCRFVCAMIHRMCRSITALCISSCSSTSCLLCTSEVVKFCLCCFVFKNVLVFNEVLSECRVLIVSEP